MNKKYLSILIILSMMVVQSARLHAGPAKKKAGKRVKVNMSLTLPVMIPETSDPAVRKQLRQFLKVADIVSSKNRFRLPRRLKKRSRREVAQWLLQASETDTDDCHKNYLNALAENIVEQSRFTTDLPRWVSLEENRAGIFFAEDERYRLSHWLMSSFWDTASAGFNWERSGFFDTYIYLNDTAETRKFREYSAALAKMQDQLPPLKKQEMPYSPRVPDFQVTHLVSSSAPYGMFLLYPGIGSGAMSRGSDGGLGFKIVVFRNVVEAYFEGVIKPIAGWALSPDRVWDVDMEAYVSNLLMRRISHHLGPVFVVRVEEQDDPAEYLEVGDPELDRQKVKRRRPKKKRVKKVMEKELKTFPDIFKRVFPVIESLKADVAALHNTWALIRNGLISEDRDINIYATYVAALVDRVRDLPSDAAISRSGRMDLDLVLPKYGSEDFLSALAQLNYFMKKEAVVFDINTKTLDVDRLKFRDAADDLTKEVFRLLDNPDYLKAESFVERQAILQPQLREVLGQLAAAPLNVEFYMEQEVTN